MIWQGFEVYLGQGEGGEVERVERLPDHADDAGRGRYAGAWERDREREWERDGG